MIISIIIPALNEADTIHASLLPLQALRQHQHEIILVDGGSHDNTLQIADTLVDRIISAPRGRARQMNAGAALAKGDVLWFLHSDTTAPTNADALIAQALNNRHRWGRFNVRLSGRNILFRLIEWMMNVRSCITGIATGDQGIFIRKQLFDQIHGYKDISLMEDIDISARLKNQAGRPACIHHRLISSSRRWEQHGIIRTVLLMWRLRLAYFMGVSPDALARHYSRE